MFQQDIFNVLFEAIIEGVIIVDDNHKIVEANAMAATLFGYAQDELINKSINILVPEESRPIHDKESKKFIRNEESRQMGKGQDLFGVRKDGTIFPVEIGLNFFKIYDKSYVMSMIIDITERKAKEQKIQELNASLEKKVKERTKALRLVTEDLKHTNIELAKEIEKSTRAENELKVSLEKERDHNALKTRFLSLVSHEFKTPLSGILTSAMLLSKYSLSGQQEKREKHIKTISDKVRYLTNILNDFLSLEKLETGKIRYNPSTFKLSKVVNEVVYNANMLLKEGQQINYPENIDTYSLYQDEKIIELILSNLVHNAIKYSPKNTTIDINITQDKKTTTFVVKDNGIGIPEGEQENIFNRYFRAENVLSTQGTGIGLNIAKHHIENLGGNISFKSKAHKGTTFTFSIPSVIEKLNI